MKINLILPGLLWPNPNAVKPAADLDLSALEHLLGHAQIHFANDRGFEPWLAREFGLSAGPLDQSPVPYAALRRLGESGTAISDGEWLCADPVHLQFARDQLILSDASDLDITRIEATTLLDGLNQLLATQEPDFVRFEAKSPKRWYLRMKTPPDVSFSPLADVIGRPIASYLPAGQADRRWQRIVNDIQVFLHTHPVNQAREAAGKRTINSIWFWGPGSLPGKLTSPTPLVLSRNRIARGLAIAAGVRPDIPKRLPQLDSLVVLDNLLQPARNMDLDAWRKQLSHIETQWFIPVLAALKSRQITELRICAPGDRSTLEARLGAIDLWKLWRRPLPLDRVSDATS
jgi:hypothetical protein